MFRNNTQISIVFNFHKLSPYRLISNVILFLFLFQNEMAAIVNTPDYAKKVKKIPKYMYLVSILIHPLTGTWINIVIEMPSFFSRMKKKHNILWSTKNHIYRNILKIGRQQF